MFHDERRSWVHVVCMPYPAAPVFQLLSLITSLVSKWQQRDSEIKINFSSYSTKVYLTVLIASKLFHQMEVVIV